MIKPPERVEVLVVGAGPVGLVAAWALQQRGVDVVVVEAQEGLDPSLRASTFHSPTLDFLDDLGLVEELSERGLKVPFWDMRLLSFEELGLQETDGEDNGRGGQARFELGALGNLTRHPYRLQCEQHLLCELIAERLSTEVVRFGQRLVSLDDRGVAVRAEVIATSGGTLAYEADVVLGADGARSTVRRLMEVGFSGATYDHASLLVTTDARLEVVFDDLAPVTYFWGRQRPFALLKLPGKWRASLYPEAGSDLEAMADLESARQELARTLPPRRLPAGLRVQHAHPYRVHARCAERFRRGRVVLAGDAAHVNPPNGGMGMNGGIHDAMHFSRSFLTVRTGGSLSALDSYARARRGVAAQFVVPRAAANRERMRTADRERQGQRLREHQRIAQDPERLLSFLRRTSMIDTLEKAEQLGK